jgi:uncharacterized protein DUF5818
MRSRTPIFSAQGMLSLFAITVMLGYAAQALQTQPARAAAFYAQEPTPAPQAPDQAQPTQPTQDMAKSTVFMGTIVKDGSNFVLRVSSGDVYKLDTPSKAQAFEGKSVKVTGKLEETGKLIHVDNIEEASA